MNNLPSTEQDFEKQGSSLVKTANTLVIVNVEDKKYAVKLTQEINAFIKGAKAFFKPMKEKAAEALEVVRDSEKKVIGIPTTAKEIILDKMTVFDREEDRKRREEAARQREEDLKKHEALMKRANARIDKVLERAKDTQETIDLLKLELENHNLSDVEHQEMLTRLELEEAKLVNDQEKINAITERVEESTYLAPVIFEAPEKVAGSVSKKSVELAVVNPMAVIKAIASGSLPVSCCKIVESEIKKVILMHDGQKVIPGVQFKIGFKTHVRS